MPLSPSIVVGGDLAYPTEGRDMVGEKDGTLY